MTDAHPPKPNFALAVGIIGHRPNRLPQGAEAWLNAEIASLLTAIREAGLAASRRHAGYFSTESPQFAVISALAEGSDRIGAHLGLKLDFALAAPLPFRASDYENDFGTEESKREFHLLLSQAGAVLEFAGDRQEEAKAYERAGIAVLDASDLLIAVWDGEPSAGRGGTTELVYEAARRGMPTIRVDPSPGRAPQLYWREGIANQAGPAYFDTPFSSDALAGTAIAVDQLIRPPKFTSEREGMRDYMHQHARRWNISLAFPFLMLIFAGRWPRWTDLRRTPPQDIVGEPRPMGFVPDALVQAHVWADEIAIYFAQLFRGAFVLNFLLSAIVTIAVVWAPPSPWSLIEIGLVLALVLNTALGRRGRWHHLWIEAREIAERLRVATPIHAVGSRLAPSYGEASSWTGWYVRALLRQVGLRSAVLNGAQTEAVRKGLHALLEDQRAYHSATARRFRALHRGLSRWATLLFVAALLVSVGFFAVEMWDLVPVTPSLHHLVIVATAGLPALAAASYGIRVIGDFDGAAARSARMASQLAGILHGVETGPVSIDTLHETSHRAADVMLGDVASWRLVVESRELEMPG
ncbi:MAG: hypothetical protein V4527_07900 [Pseudomonadota bacterium]